MKYVLMLNDMRSPNIENIQAVRVSTHRDELVNFIEDRLSEPYRDGRWAKCFRQGSELEWFNAPFDLSIDNDYMGGIWTAPDDIPEDVLLATRLSKW